MADCYTAVSGLRAIPAAFGCTLLVEGFALFEGDLPVPKVVRQQGIGPVPFWFVPADAVMAAIQDGVLTIGELAALPGRLVGNASSFNEMQHASAPPESFGGGGHRNPMLTQSAQGMLEDGRAFEYHLTEINAVVKAIELHFRVTCCTSLHSRPVSWQSNLGVGSRPLTFRRTYHRARNSGQCITGTSAAQHERRSIAMTTRLRWRHWGKRSTREPAAAGTSDRRDDDTVWSRAPQGARRRGDALTLLVVAVAVIACGDDGGPKQWPVTVTTSQAPGTTVTVDGVDQAAPYGAAWDDGESHSIGVPSPQAVGTGTRFLFSAWSDGGARTHSVSVGGDSSFTAQLGAEYELTIDVDPASTGTVDADPEGSWYGAGASVRLTAVPAAGFMFDHWEGQLRGAINPGSIAMTEPRAVTAVFAALPGSVSGRAWRAEDGSPLADRRIALMESGDTIAVTRTDANGDYSFGDVEVGDYAVAADSTGLEPFGRFVDGREQPLTVESEQDVTADFEYRLARIVVRTAADAISISMGTPVSLSLELDLSEIPLPLATLGGTISWSATVADFTENSETGGVWDQLLVNEDPVGTLNVAAVSANGVGGEVVVALGFEVLTTASGSAEFDPALSELAVIDPAIGTTVDLLAITTQVEERVRVDVQ